MFNPYELGEACHGKHLIDVRAHIRHLDTSLLLVSQPAVRQLIIL